MGYRYKAAAETEARERAFFARQVGRTSCALCSWEYVGRFGEGQKRAARHCEREHPAPESAEGRRRERDERCLELRLEGRTWPEVAELVGMSKNGAQLAAKRALARRKTFSS